MILDEIVRCKIKELCSQKDLVSENILDKQLEKFEFKNKNLFASRIKRLNRENIKIIAEIKKASPSKGIIREDFDPLEIAGIYASLKVDAISVLTERTYFLGAIEYLKNVSAKYQIPLLRKDFIVDIYQIKESILNGASAVLLIASILDKHTMRNYIDFCAQIGLDYIVEVHNRRELDDALDCEAGIIGINNRNLNTFCVDIKTTELLIDKIPDSKIVVSESGILTHKDIIYLNSMKVDAVLIGEALMKTDNIEDEFKKLFANLRDL